jgi:DNA-3-methyladenine glycosylase
MTPLPERQESMTSPQKESRSHFTQNKFGTVIQKKFFSQDTLSLAKNLLGKLLVSNPGKPNETSGIIVETEAYLFRDDPACHAARGKTPGNSDMFLPAGASYVYIIYGMYHCFNVVSNKAGIGEAVLVRALEPLRGIATMKKRRQKIKEKDLCSGPGKLCQALGISRKESGLCLRTSKLQIHAPDSENAELFDSSRIISTTRVGISSGQELQYRFYFEGSDFISRK